MLKLDNIVKNYYVGDNVVEALKGVSIEFRKSEFVSILGPSGCGKTTLLNIIGGLDKYTSGDLYINNKSTKAYKDHDWDTYRNHSIGFVFQSYNLIPHQTVLNNVELALTISGISKHERRKRAKEALEKVGLGKEINKRPNQLSGGQMQRVSIARAIVNDPEIVLADEPTGALDTATSIQVMNILKEIASDRLVIMVTHNPELAQNYSTRIVNLRDGKITRDSNPYVDDNVEQPKEEVSTVKIKRKKHSSMSFWTAFALSLNNLLTKKGRTILTAFAGSIGIIGIALILSLSNGFQRYIDKVQEDTLSTYPVTITAQSVDVTSMMQEMVGANDKKEHDLDKVYSNNIMSKMLKTMMSGIKENDLKSFKSYLESVPEVHENVSAIKYTYNANLNIYSSSYSEIYNSRLVPASYDLSAIIGNEGNQQLLSTMKNMNVWQEMLDNKTLIESQYELLGNGSRWPNRFDEVVIVVDEKNEISDYILFSLGLKTQAEFIELIANLQNPNYTPKDSSYTYEQILGLKYKLVCDSDYYVKNGALYENIVEDKARMKNLLDNSLEISVVGIVRAKEGVSASSINGAIGYSKELTEYIVNRNNNSTVLKEQVESRNINILTGNEFSKDAITGEYSEAEYFEVLRNLGYQDLLEPLSISIYPKSFEAKDYITGLINQYNEGKESEEQIQFTDYIGLMMSSISTIIDAISYVLIAFVSISLVVSSIMIGIITYISVLERTKEIGVLRSIGARKKDISRVFNAETMIIGLISGTLGILVTVLLDLPINIILKGLTNIGNIAKLPFTGAIVLIIISVLLTYIGGLIPSSYAAKKDPVTALRTE